MQWRMTVVWSEKNNITSKLIGLIEVGGVHISYEWAYNINTVVLTRSVMAHRAGSLH